MQGINTERKETKTEPQSRLSHTRRKKGTRLGESKWGVQKLALIEESASLSGAKGGVL